MTTQQAPVRRKPQPPTAVPPRATRRRTEEETGRPVWEEEPSFFGRLSKPVVLGLVVLIVAFPLYVVVVTSLSSTEAVTRAGGLVIVPRELTVAAYVQLLSGGVVTRALMISTLITVIGTFLSLAITVLAAYGLSRPGSLFHRPLLFVVLLTFLFGPGIIPSYLVVNALGLIDSYSSLILPTAVSAFNLIVMRSFFMGIPGELIDSARIDGAGEFAVLTRIVMPLSRAVVAVVGLFYAVGYWNAFFNALLYINDNNKWPLQMVLRTYIVQASPLPTGAGGISSVGLGLDPAPTLAIKMAIVVIAIVPVLVIYPFIQKHFTKGVIIGAVKG
ncbi:carbohydrate ABC transporter permease [Kribbella catacumbae]|uniref:carbohydrate ABC transporter permease n=1 Tax=Kribbella catacumbae TaxID=460086 RepID=UPI00035D7D2A|nr:carbohydrate ABC transporter permease [Kribbella catacumbae]